MNHSWVSVLHITLDLTKSLSLSPPCSPFPLSSPYLSFIPFILNVYSENDSVKALWESLRNKFRVSPTIYNILGESMGLRKVKWQEVFIKCHARQCQWRVIIAESVGHGMAEAASEYPTNVRLQVYVFSLHPQQTFERDYPHLCNSGALNSVFQLTQVHLSWKFNFISLGRTVVDVPT